MAYDFGVLSQKFVPSLRQQTFSSTVLFFKYVFIIVYIYFSIQSFVSEGDLRESVGSLLPLWVLGIGVRSLGLPSKCWLLTEPCLWLETFVFTFMSVTYLKLSFGL